MLKKTLLASCLTLACLLAFGQSTDLRIEQLKAQVKKAAETDGRSKALALALLGYDQLGADNPALQRLLYETYYATSDFDLYEETYTESSFNDADWSSDGKQLAVALADGSIRIYNTADWNDYTEMFLTIGGGILSISWSPDGNSLAYGTTEGIAGIMNASNGENTQEWSHDDYIRAVAWSPNGQYLAAGGDENILYVYKVSNGEQERSFSSHSDWIRNISWSADGQYVAAASDDATATVWSMREGNLVKTHRSHDDYCRDLGFSPNGEMLVTTSDDLNVYLYDPATSNIPSRNLKGHTNWVMAMDWGPKGRSLVTADNGGTIIVHTIKSGDQMFFNSVDTETPWMDVEFAPDGQKIIAVSAYEMAIYQLGESRPVVRLTPEGASATEESSDESPLETLLAEVLPTANQLYPSPNEQYLGIIDVDYGLQVINMQEGTVQYTISDHSDWIRDVAWSSDGNLVATGSDDQMVGVWDAQSGEMQHFLSGHTDWVRGVAFSPDNKVLASAGDDGVLRFWDPSTGDELGSTDAIGSYLMTVAWSPNQKYLSAQSSEGLLYVWDASNNDLLFTSGSGTVERSMNWTSGTELEVRDQDGSLMKWTPTGGLEDAGGGAGLSVDNNKGTTARTQGAYILLEGSQNALLQGHEAQIVDLEWSPDGGHLISQGADGNMGIWEAANARLLALMSLTDGTAKQLVWSTEGNGFYLPGAPGKVLLPSSSLRETLAADKYDAYFNESDVLRYQLETIFLQDEALATKIKANGGTNLLNAIADFYDTRAAVQVNRSNKEMDEKKAAAFRAAAGN